MTKNLMLVLAAFVLLLAAVQPAAARGHARIGVFIGGGYGYYGPYWGPYGYPYPPYYPPPVAYAPAPSVVYAAPPVVYAAPQSQGIPADQASPTFTDNMGRTCREYDTTALVGGRAQSVHGTACLQPDGSWRVVR